MLSSNTKQTLVFLHGFLGSNQDWNPVIQLLGNTYFCHSVDLYALYPQSTSNSRLIKNNFEEFVEIIISHLKSLGIFSFHLIGYSMGGRLAMAISEQIKPLSITIISSHFGLKNKDEKKKRHEINIHWVKQIQQLSFLEFLHKWYSQPIFSQSDKKNLIENRLKQEPHKKILTKMLLELSLGKQPYYLDKIPPNALFIYGEKDTKYKMLYEKHIPQSLRTEIPQAFHMPHITHPKIIGEIIKSCFSV